MQAVSIQASLSTVGPGQRPDFDVFDTSTVQQAGNFRDCRSGGNDIVDNGDMLVMTGRRIGKCLAQVAFSLPGAEAGLQRGVADSVQGVTVDGNVEFTRPDGGNFARLVIAAFEQTPAMQRHRQQDLWSRPTAAKRIDGLFAQAAGEV